MSQQEVIDILKKEGREMSVSEIAEKLNCRAQLISKHIRTLIKYSEICFIEIDRNTAMKKYKCKRRMRIYYAE